MFELFVLLERDW